MSDRMRARLASGAPACVATGLGALALAGGAGAATVPATLTVSQPCYVTVGKVSPPVTIAGTGFPAGSDVDISDKIGLDATATADATGAFSVTEPAPNPFLVDPGQKQDTITAEAFDTDGNEYQGTVTTLLSQFGADFKGSKPAPGLKALEEKLSWAFSGFPVGATIWGHYTFGGKLVASQSFGNATAPCGVLKVKQRAFPGTPRHRSYKLQIDTSRKYSKQTEPAFRTKLALTAF